MRSSFNGKWRLPLKIGATSVVLLVALALILLPRAKSRSFFSHPEKHKEPAMTAAPAPVTAGFPFDVMKWIETDQSVQAALVRTRIMKSARPGDTDLIEKEIGRILATQKPDGVFGNDINASGSTIAKLLELGCSPDRPPVRKALDVVLAHTITGSAAKSKNADSNLVLPLHNLRAACMAGRFGVPAVTVSLRQLIDEPDRLLLGGCPWSASLMLRTLWFGRTAVNTEPAIRRALRYVNDHVNDAGCLGYRDPWGLVDAAAVIDLPEAKELCRRLIPLIVRNQNTDGAWGGNPESMKCLATIAALKRHGFLEQLTKLPKQQPDWDVTRSIPLPAGNSGTLAWDGRVFWLVNWEKGELEAISRDDGAVLQRLPFPEGGCAAVGMWDGKLAVSQGKPVKRVLQLDPATGVVLRELRLPAAIVSVGPVAQVNGRLWVGDYWVFPGFAIDPQHPVPATDTSFDANSPDRLESYLAGPCPGAFAPTQDGVWQVDNFAGLLIKNGPEGKLLDWAAIPSGWTTGIAWDGEHLWSKSPDGTKFWMLQKSATAPGSVRQPGGEPAYQRDGGIGITGRAQAGTESPDKPSATKGKPISMKLKNQTYAIDWLRPDHFADTGDATIHDAGETVYNLQEDIRPEEITAVRPAETANNAWPGYWRAIAAGLKGKVGEFGLTAIREGADRAGSHPSSTVAGILRFYPKTLTRERWVGWTPEAHRREMSDDIVWLGAFKVDSTAGANGLDSEMLRIVVNYARDKGFKKIQTTACSDVRAYAEWSETRPARLFRDQGFRVIGWGLGSPDAFADMIVGAHGPEARKSTRAAIESGVNPDEAVLCPVMELDIFHKTGESAREAPMPKTGFTTALHFCASREKPAMREAAEFLVKHGANPCAVDAQGRTPLDVAKTEGMKRLLRKASDGCGPARTAADHGSGSK